MTGTALRHFLIERHTGLAETIAATFSASHSNINREEAKQDAVVAMMNVIDDRPYLREDDLALEVRRVVENVLRAQFRKTRRRIELVPISYIIGLEDGEPLESLGVLFAQRSLNPPADISPLVREEIRPIRDSAITQCQEAHPEHDGYLTMAELNRWRVNSIRNRGEVMEMRRADIAREMPDELPVAA